MSSETLSTTPILAPPTGAAPWAARFQDRLRAAPKGLLAVGGAALIAAATAATLWLQQPDYKVLYANLSEADGGTIVAELDRRNVPYEIGAGGTTIRVPEDQLYTVRLQLAEQGLPKAGNVGFELIDSQAFGISQFAEQVNYQRGLEGELARTVESFGTVERARVHLVLPKRSVFVREKELASAAVTVALASGRTLGESEVRAIVHLVASSVPQLAPDAITVVDDQGRLLSRAGASADLDDAQLQYTQEIERAYQRRIEEILLPLVGAGNVRARAVADLDFSKREKTEERFGPNRAADAGAVRSEHLSEARDTDGNTARGVPGALTNSAPNDAANGGAKNSAPGGADGGGRAQHERLVNYEVDRAVEHTQWRQVALRRLSVAVAVNHRASADGTGAPLTPLTETELAQIERLARQAMGFDAARGDAIEVVNSPFVAMTETDDPWWLTPALFNLLSQIVRYGAAAAVAAFFWFVVLRPLLRAKNTEAASPDGTGITDKSEPGLDEVGGADLLARRAEAAYEDQLKVLHQTASDDPVLVAMILRKWMHADDDHHDDDRRAHGE